MMGYSAHVDDYCDMKSGHKVATKISMGEKKVTRTYKFD